jgi:SagB-type dehydrogenase family enzyme
LSAVLTTLALVDEITLETGERSVTLTSAHGTAEYKGLTPGCVEGLRLLAAGGHGRSALEGIVLEADGIGALARFTHVLDRFVARCFVEFAVEVDGLVVARLHPTVPVTSFRLRELDLDACYRASRFAYCRHDGSGLVLESPLARARMTMSDPRVLALWAALARAQSPDELAAASADLPAEAVLETLRLLLGAGALTTVDASGAAAEDGNERLVQWEFHDLLFHSRSRIGRHNNAVGGTFRHLGSIAPPQLDRPPHRGQRIALATPAAAPRSDAERGLGAVMDARRSVRQHGDEPMTARQLGEFLFRVARLRATGDYHVASPAGDLTENLEVASKPYPSGGGLYELELYPVVDRCAGLGRGLFHFDGRRHELVEVTGPSAEIDRLLDDAASASGTASRPQMLIVLAARFGRVSWKYESIAYASILKNVGALYQTMYLAATDMGLAPCALGSGNSELFATAAGTDYVVETSVGEFMLGSLPPEPPPSPAFISNVRVNAAAEGDA